MESQPVFAEGLSIYRREAWVERIFTQVKNIIDSSGIAKLSTCTTLCTTSLINSYVRGRVYPFINIPIRLYDQELLGLYEFCEQLPLSDQHIYCDFIVHAIYYAENKQPSDLRTLEERACELIEAGGYQVVNFTDGMAAIIIARKVLEREAEFTDLLHGLIDLGIRIQADMEPKDVAL